MRNNCICIYLYPIDTTRDTQIQGPIAAHSNTLLHGHRGGGGKLHQRKFLPWDHRLHHYAWQRKGATSEATRHPQDYSAVPASHNTEGTMRCCS